MEFLSLTSTAATASLKGSILELLPPSSGLKEETDSPTSKSAPVEQSNGKPSSFEDTDILPVFSSP